MYVCIYIYLLTCIFLHMWWDSSCDSFSVSVRAQLVSLVPSGPYMQGLPAHPTQSNSTRHRENISFTGPWGLGGGVRGGSYIRVTACFAVLELGDVGWLLGVAWVWLCLGWAGVGMLRCSRVGRCRMASWGGLGLALLGLGWGWASRSLGFSLGWVGKCWEIRSYVEVGFGHFDGWVEGGGLNHAGVPTAGFCIGCHWVGLRIASKH